MTDKNEMNNLIDESFRYPDGLSLVEHRLEKRLLREKRKKRALISSISSVAAAVLFIVLVNTSTAFAGIVADIPLVGKLAEFVKFDKSLSSAIENEYIQETGLISYDGQEKLLLPYVIADEKNLVLFFQLPDKFELSDNQWAGISLTSMEDSTGEKIEGFSYSTSNISSEEIEKNGGLILQQYHFSESMLPGLIKINVALKKETYEDTGDEKVSNINDVEEPQLPLTETLGNFSFSIDFNEFAKPITYSINEEHIIMGQKMTLREMKVYPTGTEVLFEFSKDNSAWIKGFDIVVEQAGAEIFKGRNGLSATYDELNKWMKVYIESDYFEKTKKQELVIKGIRILEKDKEFITVDLEKGTFYPQVKGMELSKIVKREGKADLLFSTKVTNDECVGLFSSRYKDDEGNSYEFRTEGSSVLDSVMETSITVEYPSSGTVILQRSLTPKIMLENPIRVSLPIKE